MLNSHRHRGNLQYLVAWEDFHDTRTNGLTTATLGLVDFSNVSTINILTNLNDLFLFVTVFFLPVCYVLFCRTDISVQRGSMSGPPACPAILWKWGRGKECLLLSFICFRFLELGRGIVFRDRAQTFSQLVPT